MAADRQIGFGVIGCADIARKVSRAISLAPNARIVAVGSRSIEKAKRFAIDNNLPSSVNVYGSYEAVLDDPGVDAVYVPLPTSLHAQWGVMVAQKKKHLLLEKPVALDVSQLDLILEACRSNGVQYMDSTMWMHHPRTHKMVELFSDPQTFGSIKMVHSVFTYAADVNFMENDIRVKPDLDALGALGDEGWYCIRAILWAVGYQLPKSLTALRGALFNKAGVLVACGASLVWDDDKIATFHCSFMANLTMDLTVIGTNSTLHLSDFIIPFEENSATFSISTRSNFDGLVTRWETSASKHVMTTELPQEACMIKEFSRLASSSPDPKWPTISRKTQLVVDAVKTSIIKGFQPVEIIE